MCETITQPSDVTEFPITVCDMGKSNSTRQCPISWAACRVAVEQIHTCKAGRPLLPPKCRFYIEGSYPEYSGWSRPNCHTQVQRQGHNSCTVCTVQATFLEPRYWCHYLARSPFVSWCKHMLLTSGGSYIATAALCGCFENCFVWWLLVSNGYLVYNQATPVRLQLLICSLSNT